jgi:hypothetical protein
MGVLDDAIREHLELKRRHGASDEEVAQEEAEALGPARRDFPSAGEEAEAEESAETAGEEQIADEQIAEQPTAVEPPEPEPAPEPEPEPEQALEPEPVPEPEPEPELGRGNREPATESEQEPEEPPGQDDEDVLEETPEFLQDAPEHDRLWFEQKPPRDFDFE